MYKCGWNGCEKAYGTLNHLNAHVTMQSHGQKRTPEGKSILSLYMRNLLPPVASYLTVEPSTRTLGQGRFASGPLHPAPMRGERYTRRSSRSIAPKES